MIRVGILGISGYTGKEVFKLLLEHPYVRITYVAANTTVGSVVDIWPEFAGRTKLQSESLDVRKVAKECDVVFLALPHTESMKSAPYLLEKGVKVIDLSGDYRLNKASIYKKWYKTSHLDSRRLNKAVYGLPELFRAKIQRASLVANPGCYPTAAILSLAPLAAMKSSLIDSIVIDAKSGVSGAGRKATVGLLAAEVAESFKPYKVLEHQHTPEIQQYVFQLAEKEYPFTFVTHLLPIIRGIEETIYVRLKKPLTENETRTLYRKFYKTEPFVRVLSKGQQPEIKNVAQTNFCDISVNVGEDKTMLVITSAIDNLLKGAAGQAVQNLNIMQDYPETTGLL